MSRRSREGHGFEPSQHVLGVRVQPFTQRFARGARTHKDDDARLFVAHFIAFLVGIAEMLDQCFSQCVQVRITDLTFQQRLFEV